MRSQESFRNKQKAVKLFDASTRVLEMRI